MMMTGTKLIFINYFQTEVDIEIKTLHCKYLQIYLKWAFPYIASSSGVRCKCRVQPYNTNQKNFCGTRPQIWLRIHKNPRRLAKHLKRIWHLCKKCRKEKCEVFFLTLFRTRRKWLWAGRKFCRILKAFGVYTISMWKYREICPEKHWIRKFLKMVCPWFGGGLKINECTVIIHNNSV